MRVPTPGALISAATRAVDISAASSPGPRPPYIALIPTAARKNNATFCARIPRVSKAPAAAAVIAARVIPYLNSGERAATIPRGQRCDPGRYAVDRRPPAGAADDPDRAGERAGE